MADFLEEFEQWCKVLSSRKSSELDTVIEELGQWVTKFYDFIKQLQAELGKAKELQKWYEGEIYRLEMAKQKYKAELDKHRWIPVTERLPEEGLAVLTLMEGGYIGKCEVIDNEWQHLGEDIITHWKPIILPEQALKEK